LRARGETLTRALGEIRVVRDGADADREQVVDVGEVAPPAIRLQRRVSMANRARIDARSLSSGSAPVAFTTGRTVDRRRCFAVTSALQQLVSSQASA
jgi:hypothetical protein